MVSTAVNGIANFAKSNAHVLVIVGRFSFAPAAGHVGIFVLFHPVQWYHAGQRPDHLYRRRRDIKGAENGLQKVRERSYKKIKRTPTEPSPDMTSIESLERRIQEAEAAEVNEMVRTAKVTPEQLAALLRQSTNTTPNPGCAVRSRCYH